MAWIEVHQALRDHRKILDLSEALDLPEPYIVGHLVYLWLWAVDNAPDGVLPSSRRIIEKAAAWQGQQGRLVDALITCGLLDDNGVLSIHDWDDYVGKLIDQRQSNAARQRAHREREKAKKNTVTDSNTFITVTSPSRNGATVPNSTQPNRTEPLSLTHARAREDREREAMPVSQDEDEVTPPPATPSDDLSEKKRRNWIRAECVEAWGQPDAAERAQWNAGITQLYDAGYTGDQIREAIPLFMARRPLSKHTPAVLAREIRSLFSEANHSPPAQASPTPTSPQHKNNEPTQEEWEAMNAKILDALSN